ncbi:autophagy-related protein 16-2 isoform X2 [Zalophus californianus]|uniref:Protein Atg16l2 n=1 Tax=Zalophus californianus TaxID=9704 RepID=A0A6J2C1X8_ZALCA|nr:autophagy-related protein 16-2 isoform X2 [Zalophus californianus]
MAGPGAPGVPVARWKRHIVRQLRQRDRTQKTLFVELVPAYNRLLEKAELLGWISEKLQLEPNDVTPATLQGPWEEESGPDSDQVPPPTTLRVKWQKEEEGLRQDCGKMAYQVVEKSAALGALEATLEERQSRLAALEACAAELQEARARQTQQVDAQRALNVAQRAAYEALRAQARLREAALRRLEEEAHDLLERLVQRKARAAAERNLRLERHEKAKQARMSLELKKAAKRIVSISESPNTIGGIREEAETLALPAEPLSLKSGTGEKWKRPFRSMRLPCQKALPNAFLTPAPHPVSRRGEATPLGELLSRDTRASLCVWLPNLLPRFRMCCSVRSSVAPWSPLLAVWGDAASSPGPQKFFLLTWERLILPATTLHEGSQVLAATYSQAAQLWKVGEVQSKETLSGHTDKVTAAKFKLTRHQAVTGSRDRTVKEWDLGRAYCSRTINVLSYCNDVVCGDHVIISGHNDQKIRFWDSRVPCCTQVIPVQGRVTSLNLSQDQLHLLSCSRDDTLKVIDLRVNNIRQAFRADGFRCGSDWTKAVFSPDRSYVLAGSWDGALYIWDVDTGKLEGSLRGPHCTAVNAVAWCSSGSHVVSVDQARKVVLWH